MTCSMGTVIERMDGKTYRKVSEVSGPRNWKVIPKMTPAAPLAKERGWGTGTWLMSAKWKGPKRISLVRSDRVHLSVVRGDGELRGQKPVTRFPLDVQEAPQL